MKSNVFCGLNISSIEKRLTLALCAFPCLPSPLQENVVHAVPAFTCIFVTPIYLLEVCFVSLCCVPLANPSVFCS